MFLTEGDFSLTVSAVCIHQGPRGQRGPRGATGKPGAKVCLHSEEIMMTLIMVIVVDDHV